MNSFKLWINKIFHIEQELMLLLLACIIIIGVLLLVAYAILLERKVLASIQRRRGPNLVGFFGLLQPIADAIKLITKETVIPVLSNKIIFIIAPLLTLILSLLNWSILPFSTHSVFSDIRVSILMFFALSSLTVYGIIMSGWASNSKYAFLGALRAAAQVIAYEVSIGLILIYVIIQGRTLNYFEIILSQENIWNIMPCFIFFILFSISTLAETNRPPFDLPEAEAELVSGYNVEYSAMSFGFFFLGEYVAIWTVSFLNIILFWGGYLIFFKIESIFILSLKVIAVVITFIWVRGSVPRYRYDQLMRLGWKILLPIALGSLILYTGVYENILFKLLFVESSNNYSIIEYIFFIKLEKSRNFANFCDAEWFFNEMSRRKKMPLILNPCMNLIMNINDSIKLKQLFDLIILEKGLNFEDLEFYKKNGDISLYLYSEKYYIDIMWRYHLENLYFDAFKRKEYSNFFDKQERWYF